MTSLGIDLGTTLSAVAIVDPQGHPIVPQTKVGAALTPSVVCFTEECVVIGETAKELQSTETSGIREARPAERGKPAGLLSLFRR